MPAGARRSDVGEAEGPQVDSRSIRRNWPLFDLARFDTRPTSEVISRAVATINKTWSWPRSRRVGTRPSRSIESRVFRPQLSDGAAERSPRAQIATRPRRRDLGVMRWRIDARPGAMPHRISARLGQSQQDGQSRLQDPFILPRSLGLSARADSAACSRQRD
jgi:hypothetical protein